MNTTLPTADWLVLGTYLVGMIALERGLPPVEKLGEAGSVGSHERAGRVAERALDLLLGDIQSLGDLLDGRLPAELLQKAGRLPPAPNKIP